MVDIRTSGDVSPDAGIDNPGVGNREQGEYNQITSRDFAALERRVRVLGELTPAARHRPDAAPMLSSHEDSPAPRQSREYALLLGSLHGGLNHSQFQRLFTQHSAPSIV
ncbi:MAG: hypothetical protein AAFP04_14680 [Myxococcota bacterium]